MIIALLIDMCDVGMIDLGESMNKVDCVSARGIVSMVTSDTLKATMFSEDVRTM